jgi:alpha-beta hydrolase superfamily lysophospholipase
MTGLSPSQTDFTEDLKKIRLAVLVMHSEDDQVVPYADSGPLSAKLLKNGTLKTYKDFPHGSRRRRRPRSTPTYWHSSRDNNRHSPDYSGTVADQARSHPV